MSSKGLLYRIVGIVTVLLVGVGCGYDRHEECELELSTLAPNMPLSQLTEYAEQGVTIPDGVVIEGRVVANDVSGNFYQSLVVEQGGVGVELRLALYDLHALFPVGCGVVADVGGLWVARYNGVLQIGCKESGWSNGVVPVAPRSEILGRVAVCKAIVGVVAQSCTIATLSEEMCGRLVRIEGVSHKGESAKWGVADYGSTADRVFVDEQGREIVVRTSSYANFAGETVPQGVVDLVGVLYCLQKDDGTVFVLKLRDRDDIVRE